MLLNNYYFTIKNRLDSLHNISMTTFLKKVSLSVPVLFLFLAFSHPVTVQAQQFEEGLELYQDGDYERAASVFNKLRNSRSYLFAGKSYYAMQRYQQAQSNLNNISPESPPAIYYESVYTSALIDFQLKQFGDALSKLHQVLMKEDLDNSLTLDANQLYGQILGYLTAGQRRDAMSAVSASQLKFDLLQSAMGKVGYDEARELLELYEASVGGEWRDKASEIAETLSSESSYTNSYGNNKALLPPEGTIYNLGIALPEYQPDATEFSIVKSLYMGAFLAGDDFNDEHDNVKVAMHFINTGTGTDTVRSAIEEFAENEQGDALIGPLFSDQAVPMIPHLNQYKIPAIAPLANSEINSEDSYLFQANPTFAIHGREMARYAVNELNMKRFAVIAKSGTAGASSAEAFRDEAEKLGAQIQHYFVEDLHSNEYEISQYTQQFSSSEQEPIDAVYAPVTGRGALTLIDLLLVNLRVMIEPPAVLGSQEWQRLDYSSNKYNRLHIYYTQGYYSDDHGLRMSRFRNNYQRKFNTDPNQFSMIGYDVATFMLNTLDEVGNPTLLKSAMLKHRLYRGLINDILFDGDNINNALKIIEVTEGNISVR